MTAANLTDLGNMDRFVRDHVERLRYVAQWNTYVPYEGGRWHLTKTGIATHLATETVRGMFAEAEAELVTANRLTESAAENADDEGVQLQKERATKARKLFAHALKSHDRARVEAMVHLAKSDPRLAISYGDLDADAWLFNVPNGTINLRTGELQPHRRDDLITKLSPVPYDPDATCPTWDVFLEQAQAGNREMITFIQRALGYSLTGAVLDHVLLFLYGPAGTGKSTLFRISHALYGDYAVRAPRSLLFTSRGERHPTELASLFKARFVTCNEIDEGATFDEALLKDLTGGEEISARRMREDFWTFGPTHKLAIGGNYKPRVRNFDDAIRRRLRLIPWTVKPPTVDTRLYEKLCAELPGILAWTVRGCLDWQRHGLGEPLCVREATDEYQSESDPFGEFFELHCVFESKARTPRVQIRQAYEDYCKENGAQPLGARLFADALKRNGVESANVRHLGKTMNGWSGVRLATDQERDRVGSGYQRGTNLRMIGDSRDPPHTDGQPEVGTHEVPTTHGDDEDEAAEREAIRWEAGA